MPKTTTTHERFWRSPSPYLRIDATATPPPQAPEDVFRASDVVFEISASENTPTEAASSDEVITRSLTVSEVERSTVTVTEMLSGFSDEQLALSAHGEAKDVAEGYDVLASAVMERSTPPSSVDEDDDSTEKSSSSRIRIIKETSEAQSNAAADQNLQASSENDVGGEDLHQEVHERT